MSRHNVTPEEAARARARMQASIAANYIQCPACGDGQAGPLHRTSARLWQGRADRARSNGGTDPLSSVTLEDAERHLAAIGSEGVQVHDR